MGEEDDHTKILPNSMCASRKYGEACIVFDGYEQGPSTKDHEHQRRVN